LKYILNNNLLRK